MEPAAALRAPCDGELKALRKLSDSRGAEGAFGGWRVNRSGATNTVIFTMKQAAEKASADFRREDAKAVTTPLRMQWEPPKYKKETWSTVAPPALSREWLACKSLLGTMAYDELAGHLANGIYDQKNGAIADALAILEKHVPSGASLIRGTPEWSNPLSNRPWKKM